MKPTLFFPALLLLSSFAASETPINELLRDGLYAEEVSRDVEAAAKNYGEVLGRYAGQRQFAATALFRLAEVRRKQGRKDEAVALYQRLLSEFPDSEAQVNLAKENLSALGGKIPEQGIVAEDEESKELARIRNLEKTSPDIAANGSLLTAATKANQLRVVTYLLGRGANPNVMGEGVYGDMTPLSMAAINGNLAMCELLLKAGADVAGNGDYRPMEMAIDSCRVKIVELLLRSGVDVNKKLSKGRTPLLNAIARGHPPTVALLLDSGADVNVVIPGENLSALHMATFFENIKLVERLVKMGADPFVESKVKWKSDSMPYSQAPFQIQPGDTPLMVAVGRNNMQMMELLLSNTRNPDLAPLLARAVEEDAREATAWLLEKGGNANGTGAQGIPLLIRAVRQWDPELMRLLLDRGADPNVVYNGRMVPANTPDSHVQDYSIGVYSPLRIAAGANISESRPNAPKAEVFRLLVQAGAKPDEEWLKSLLDEHEAGNVPRGGTHEVRRMMAERFIIPALAGRPAVTAMIAPFYQNPVLLQAQSGGAPLDLARLLLMPESALKLPVTEPFHNGQPPTRVAIWRKDSEGTMAKAWTGSLDQKDPFPALKWGDVIELHHQEPVSDGTNLSFRDGFPDDLKWELQRKISFPVSIEVDGRPVTYQMRGDRVVFDPTKRELPWVRLDRLATIFAGPDESLDEAVVIREGWPDVRLDNRAMSRFPLNAGDSIRFTGTPHARRDPVQLRKGRVLLQAPGQPATRSYLVLINPWDEQPDRMPPPTLTEALADILSMRSASPRGTTPAEMISKIGQSFRIETLWMQPDFSAIRIRRLTADGSEKILPVDFAAVIATTTVSASADEVRKRDIPLQGGDIVEVPLKGDPDGTWHGLTASEEAFFAKVLSCRIQHTDDSGGLDLKELRFKAHEFAATEAGKLPVTDPADEDAVQTLRAYDALLPERNVIKVVRDGEAFSNNYAAKVFLHDGDQVTTVRADPPLSVPRPQPRRVITPQPEPVR